MRFLSFLLLPLAILWSSCNTAPEVADLLIRDATIFDTQTGKSIPNQTVSIRNGIISSISSSGTSTMPKAHQIIEADGRLLTPGFIDVHHHTADILADSSNGTGGTVANLSMHPDSVIAYRRIFANEILPYGVTVVREAGGDDTYLPLMKAWMTPVPWAPDFYPSGGALVSHEEGRTPFSGHTVVNNPAHAAQTVQQYHEAGFKHIKLYWRLREPEFRAAYDETKKLGMIPYGHIDNKVISIPTALSMGLRHFEHVYTLGTDAATQDEMQMAWVRTVETLGKLPPAPFLFWAMEVFNGFSDDDARLQALVNELAATGSTVTPTLHAFANPFGLAPVTTSSADPVLDATSVWTAEQMARAREGYARMALLVRQLHEAGVGLALGTDTAEPGRSALSEIVLLHRAGISMSDTLQIATFGSARALGLSNEYGIIEPGRRAHLVLFDENPIQQPEAILGGKTVIKDGEVVQALTSEI